MFFDEDFFRSVKLDFHRAFIIPKFSVCGSFFHLVTIVVLLEGLLSLRFFAINFTELQSWELDPRQVVQSVSDSFPEALTLQLKENKITMNRKKPFKLDLPAVYQTFFERTMFWMTRGKIPEDVWNAYELPEPTIYFTSDKHVGSYLNSYRGLQTESIFVFTETKVYFMGMAMSVGKIPRVCNPYKTNIFYFFPQFCRRLISVKDRLSTVYLKS